MFCTEMRCCHFCWVCKKNCDNWMWILKPFARVYFLLCLHELNNSSLELSVASLGLYRMKYFSRRQSLQTPVTGLKLLALPSMLQYLNTLKKDFFTFNNCNKKARILFASLLSKVVSTHDTLRHWHEQKPLLKASLQKESLLFYCNC